ncbi:F-box only protein 34 [Coregonus clupeaformis]|uniref:F-box only protein 34 n=1 Tax=Coregonus clupeaformis TaxID=59861 RepID=UPI001E1C5E3D|nr:F-box only protein 34 [Coregonus clupeaformis]
MHLKPYPKLQKKELHLESSQDSQRGLHHVSQQGALSLRTEWGVRPAVALVGSPSSGLGPCTARSPLSVISTNTLCCSNNNNGGSNHHNNSTHGNRGSGLQTSRLSGSGGDVFHSSTTWARRKTSETSFTTTSSLLLLSTSSCTSSTGSVGSENQEASLSISYQGEDGEGPLDIWAVIKPGNTKEKIAIFASPQCHSGLVNGGGGGESVREAREGDLVSRSSVRTVSVKIKSCWEDEGGSVAKRKRRSGHRGHHQDRDKQSPRALETQSPLSPTENSPVEMSLSESPRVPECGEVVVGEGGEQVCRVEGEEGSDTGTGKALSVVELVAFLEQRASDKQGDSKPVSLRSSTSITLSRGLSLTLELQQPRAPDQSPQATEEEAECVKVSDMVAKLESECLKRQSVTREGSGSGGELSRNNSLRRRVGRVLLAGADACSISAQPPTSPTGPHHGLEETTGVQHLHASPSEGRPSVSTIYTDKLAPSSCHEAAHWASCSSDPASPSHSVDSGCGASIHVVSEPEEICEAQGQQEGSMVVDAGQDLHFQLQSEQARASSSSLQSEEPLPGMLFFSHPLPSQPALEQQHTLPHPDNTHTHTHTTLDTESSPKLTRDLVEPSKTQPCDPAITSLLLETISHSENWAKEEDEREEKAVSEGEGSAFSRCETVPFPLRRLVSHEFLEMRFKIQLLLEPQQYMAFLPHHIIVKMFCMLPTESLAALKCTCLYFKFLIESYGIRPADSRWVCDPRYKDDPCKQCKKRYGRGDVSLCRWHHKPYCQALPYGPGYWMCCHGSHKDTPGCNVGLHDNRWVPAFHSINMPIYKKPREVTEE